jgi:biotin carboxylase
MSGASRELPALVIVFDPSLPILKILEESAGVWRTVWLIDRAEPGVEEMARQLHRLGEVIDATGLTPAQATAAAAGHDPRGAIAFSDAGVPIAATIGAALGLPAYSAQTVERLSNKVAQRTALRAAGVPVPAFWVLPARATTAEVSDLAAGLHYPVVVKPQSGSGSSDTYLARNAEELRRAVDGRLHHDQDLIIEGQLADGWPQSDHPHADFVSVESIVARGQVSHLAVTGRARLAEPFRETGAFIPSGLPADDLAAVLDTASAAVAAMDAVTGVFHTEIKLTPDGPRVIEVNGRLGGFIAQVLQAAAGQPIFTIAARVALGEAVAYDRLLPCLRVGFTMLVVPALEASRLTRLDGLGEVNQIAGIRGLTCERQVGDRLDWRDGFDGRIATIFGEADDLTSMWEARQRVSDTLDIGYERG